MGRTEYVEKKKQEEKEREESFSRIAEEFSPGVADAIKEHFAIYDERFYLWLADLYDPGKYDEDGNPLGGGFYYSNSARDNEGFLIDVESTNQALNFFRSAGMLRGYDDDYLKAFPEKTVREIVAFTLSLQSSENGYFYHPQWGKDITAGRLSRDIGSAVDILRKFGMKPNWNTPSGVEGTYGYPSGVKKKGDDGETIIKRDWPKRLKTLENWKAYIDEFRKDIDSNSYSIGHIVGEQAMQLIVREEEAVRNDEPTGFIKYTVDFFNECQNPENGLWHKDVTYASVNGLMKTMRFFTDCKIKLNYAKEAFTSAAEMIINEGPDRDGRVGGDSVSVYNPWVAVNRIMENVRVCGDPDMVKELRGLLVERAEDMIRATTRKTLRFKKEDGSYGYWFKYSPDKSQGAPASVPETIEGDVNGGTIAVNGITGEMLMALGIKDAYIFAPSDFEVFIDRITKRKTMDKSI